MTKYLLRRTLYAIFIIVFGSLIVYATLRLLPVSYFEKIARERSSAPNAQSYSEILSQLNKVYSLDTDILTGFVRWGGNAIRGDFGNSWEYGIPVVEKFKEVIWYSVFLNIITLLVETFISIPLGVIAARKQYSKTDYAITVIAMICISLPTFFLATILKYIFSVKLGWFDLYGIVGRYYEQLSFWGKIGDMAKHLVLPVITLAILHIGGLMRYTRTNMLEVLNADYIRTARAKGLPEKVVISKHAFRNTLIPLVTYFSTLIPSMFSGSFITETLYQIPGIGYISYNALIHGDIPFAMFYSVLIILLTQISLLIADFMYAVVDPRVRID